MGLFKRAAKAVARPAIPHFDRRVDFVVASTYARREELSALEEVAAELRATTVEVRRLLADDLDAATETAALLGRSLAHLTEAVEQLSEEMGELRQRIERLAGTPEVEERPPSS